MNVRQMLACGAAAWLATCGGEPVVQQPEGHRRMVQLLDELAVQAAETNVFFGERTLRQNRAELQRLGAQAPWRLHLDTGTGELKAGNEREAIAVLAAARQRLQAGTLAGGADAAVAISFHLGVAYMRLAETENCCATPTHETCILPIVGTGTHGKTEGASNAAYYFLEVLRNTPPAAYWHLDARWLLNIAHMSLGTYPAGVPERERMPARLFAPESDFPRFRNVAPEVGLDTWGYAGGIVVDDFDGDEHLDVLASDWSPRGQLRFYRNARDGTFVDRTEAAGLLGLTGGLNLVQADYDNDGDLDFLVLRGGWWFETGRQPNSLVRNNGDGTFTDVTFAAGLGEGHYPTQTGAFCDCDRDGDLDLYVGNENSPRQACASQLFRNDGNGTFTEIAAAAGVGNHAYAKGVTWGDYDGDGWSDLYVSNIDGDNRLYRNRGDGTFADVAKELGVTKPKASFPTWFWDFDNDGALDLFVANYNTGIGHIAAHLLGMPMPRDRLCLYHNDGKGHFTEVAAQFGLDYPSMPMGCNFGDVDNDGWLDFYLGTGDPEYYSLMPNLLYRNERGRGFRSVTMASGTGHLQKGHGVAIVDLDHDGDQDIAEVVGGAYPGDAFRNVVFENPGFGNHWVTLRLVGTESNRSAIGARIRVVTFEDGAERSIYRHVNSGGSFGCNPLRQTIGLGRAERIVRIEVCWPRSGALQVVEGAALDSALRIVEGKDGATRLPIGPVPFRRR